MDTKTLNINYDRVIELLTYLATQESFTKAQKDLKMSKSEIAGLLRDTAQYLEKEVSEKATLGALRRSELPERVTRLLSKLTPAEEQKIIRTFKIA